MEVIMKRGINPIIPVLIGGIFILLTVAFFFLLDIETNTLNYTALGFNVFAEIVFFGFIAFLGGKVSASNNVFRRSGTTVVLGIYLFATLLLSLFSGIFAENLKRFVLVEIVFISLTAVLVILILAISARINAVDKQAEESNIVADHTPKRGGF
jgi:hypothetical protein